jgi:hypothetical protein
MKLEHREITELHLLALAEWDRFPRVVRLINFAHVIHVRFLAWFIRKAIHVRALRTRFNSIRGRCS